MKTIKYHDYIYIYIYLPRHCAPLLGVLLCSILRRRSDVILKAQWPKENASQGILPPPGMELVSLKQYVLRVYYKHGRSYTYMSFLI